MGIRKGKHQKILHNHANIIANTLVGLKSKRVSSKNLENDERKLLEHYLRIVKTFGVDQIYLFNIGIIEILTRKELDHGHMRYFISKLLLGGIREGSYQFYDIMISLARILVFCSEIKSCLTLKEGEIDSGISSGIAKKTIIDFFGIVKDKFKRVIVKKMLLFIRSIFQSSPFIETFKLTLVEMSSFELEKLLSLFT